MPTDELEAAQQAIGRLTIQLQSAREEADLSDSTINECAELLHAYIIEDDVAIDALVLDAIKRVIAERDRLALALREARRELPMFESGFGIEKAKRVIDRALEPMPLNE